VVLAEEANRTSNRNRCTKKQLRRVGSEKGTSPMMVAMAAFWHCHWCQQWDWQQ